MTRVGDVSAHLVVITVYRLDQALQLLCRRETVVVRGGRVPSVGADAQSSLSLLVLF